MKREVDVLEDLYSGTSTSLFNNKVKFSDSYSSLSSLNP